MKKCALCSQKPPIKNSHVVSAFVVRWLKASTPHATLRHSNDIGKPYQDGWKDEYFCLDCEAKFSKWEDHFSRNVFNPFVRGSQRVFPVSSESLLFVASLHYRCLVHWFSMFPSEATKAPQSTMYNTLSSVCASGAVPSSGFNAYLEFVPKITPEHGGWPPGVNTYIRESIDYEVFPWVLPDGKQLWCSYVKLPSIILIFSESELGNEMRVPPLFDPYRMQPAGNLDANIQSMLLLNIMKDTVQKRAYEIQANYQKIPTKQREKLISRIVSHPNKESFRAHETYLADKALLGQRRADSE